MRHINMGPTLAKVAKVAKGANEVIFADCIILNCDRRFLSECDAIFAKEFTV